MENSDKKRITLYDSVQNELSNTKTGSWKPCYFLSRERVYFTTGVTFSWMRSRTFANYYKGTSGHCKYTSYKIVHRQVILVDARQSWRFALYCSGVSSYLSLNCFNFVHCKLSKCIKVMHIDLFKYEFNSRS
jgi:hypothetical protein